MARVLLRFDPTVLEGRVSSAVSSDYLLLDIFVRLCILSAKSKES